MIRILVIVCVCVFGAIGASAQTLELDKELKSGATAGCAPSVSPPAPNSRRSADSYLVLPPATGTYLGAYQIPAQPAEVSRFANAVGQMPPIVFSFHDFFSDGNNSTQPDRNFSGPMEGDGSPSPLQMAHYLYENGSVLSLGWAVYCCEIEKVGFWLRMKKPHDHINRLLAGQHDDLIRDTARRIRDWGGPIMMTLTPEMSWQGQFLFGENGRRWMDSVSNLCNEYGDPTWPDGPERIRDLFIHFIDIFREEGAHNVTWMMYAGSQYMAPNVEGQTRWLHPQYYYPGDDYIDWIGQSVYFTDPAWNHGFEDTGSFEEVFMPGYRAWTSVTKKPMMLAEFGLISRKGDDRSALWRKTLGQYLKSVPQVKAVTIADSLLFEDYFNAPMPSRSANDAAVIREFIANDPYYQSKLRFGRGG